MSEIYVEYIPTQGFSRANDKGSLKGTIMSYADFKANTDAIEENGDAAGYGVILSSSDVKDFIENYEDASIFTDAEKA